jgi:signal transduction histidine kinase
MTAEAQEERRHPRGVGRAWADLPLRSKGLALINEVLDIAAIDRQRLKQVLLNLLSNAVKCNRDGGGSVQLSCEPVAGERLRIKVTDTGLGISPEALGRLFVPFERVAREQSAIEGTGLGLPLSKRLADPDRPLHRGQPVQPSAGRAGPEPPAGCG